MLSNFYGLEVSVYMKLSLFLERPSWEQQIAVPLGRIRIRSAESNEKRDSQQAVRQ